MSNKICKIKCLGNINLKEWVFLLFLVFLPAFCFASDPFGFDAPLISILKWLSSGTSILVGGVACAGAFIALIFSDIGATMKMLLKIVIGVGGAMSAGGMIAMLFGSAGAVI